MDRSSRSRSSLFILLIVIGAVIDQLEGVSISDVEDQINEFVEATMASKSIPGLSLSIVNGEELFSQGYGVKTLNTTDYVTADTLFYLASTTKAFTATLLGQLLKDRDNYTLETPIKEILPDFALEEFYRQQQSTSTDLLAHRVGILDSVFNYMMGEVKTREDVARRSLYFRALEPFRDLLQYSNLFYTIAGYVIEAVSATGETWEQLVRRRLFQPLAMNSSTFIPELTPEQQQQLVATPYDADKRNNNTIREISTEIYKYIGVGAGAGGSIISNARDLTKWLYMLTHGGLNEAGQRVVDEDVLANTWSPHIVAQLQPGRQPYTQVAENYGFGWVVGFYNGYRMASHTGYMYGYRALATVYPAVKLGIYTCINGQIISTDGQREIHNFITDLLMPPATNNNNNKNTRTATSRRPSAARQAVKNLYNDRHHHHHQQQQQQRRQSLDSEERHRNPATSGGNPDLRELEEYEGTYGNFAMGNASFVLNASSGRLRLSYGVLMKVELTHVAGEKFVGVADEPLWFFPAVDVTFRRRTADNAVVNVTIPSLMESDPPVFVRGLQLDDAPGPPTCDC